MLRGEGIIIGKFFDLVTWRREGLMARIRERGFNVRTLADRVERLPAIGPVDPPLPEGVRVLSHAKERIATFQRDTLHWRDLPVIDHQGKASVRVPGNVAIRRRKSRGHSDYYITTPVGDGHINFLPTKEADALLHAYAQFALNEPPATLRFVESEDGYVVPERQAILPPPHQDVLSLLVRDKAERWTFPKNASELAEAVFEKLGIELQPRDA